MKPVKIHYEVGVLTAEIYNALRGSVGWGTFPEKQAECALKNSLYTIVASVKDQAVGMARLVGDGAINWYIQDLVIHPGYQHCGTGGVIMDMLIEHIKSHSSSDTRVTVGLFAAKGKEGFYERYGFTVRPHDTFGAGMEKRIPSRKGSAC